MHLRAEVHPLSLRRPRRFAKHLGPELTEAAPPTDPKARPTALRIAGECGDLPQSESPVRQKWIAQIGDERHLRRAFAQGLHVAEQRRAIELVPSSENGMPLGHFRLEGIFADHASSVDERILREDARDVRGIERGVTLPATE